MSVHDGVYIFVCVRVCVHACVCEFVYVCALLCL